jgi:hypothetical protein
MVLAGTLRPSLPAEQRLPDDSLWASPETNYLMRFGRFSMLPTTFAIPPQLKYADALSTLFFVEFSRHRPMLMSSSIFRIVGI